MVNLFITYILGIALILYAFFSLNQMFRDGMHRSIQTVKPTISRYHLPMAESWSRWAYILLIAGGSIIGTWYYFQENLIIAFSLPIPFFLLARFIQPPSEPPPQPTPRMWDSLFIIILMIFGSVIRIIRINDIPPGVNFDEVVLALDIQSLTDKRQSVFAFSSFYGYPKISYLPLALFADWFPFSRLILRSDAILWGILGLPAFYFLSRIFFSVRLAQIVTLIFTASPYHLFYSRIHCGAKLTFLEIIWFYFFITSFTTRSRWRMIVSSISVNILLYDYLSARVIVFFIFSGFFIIAITRKIPLKNVLSSCLLMGFIILLLLSPIAWLWKTDPTNFYFTRTSSTLVDFSRDLDEAIRNSVLMFKDEKFGQDGVFTQANASVLHPALLTMCLTGLFSSLFLFPIWPYSFVGACTILSLMPSFVSSIEGNSHRSMMIIPLLFLLFGLGIQTISGFVNNHSRHRFTLIAGTVLAIWIIPASLSFFFKGMWDIDRARLENNWSSTAIRSTESMWRLHDQNSRCIASNPSEYWFALVGNSEPPAWRHYSDLFFQSRNWLPENWLDRDSVLILADFDQPLHRFLQQTTTGYRWEDVCFPYGKTQLLLGHFSTPAKGAFNNDRDHPRQVDIVGRSIQEWKGSLMFDQPYLLHFTDPKPPFIWILDGQTISADLTGLLFAEGLHELIVQRDLNAEINIEQQLPVLTFDLFPLPKNDSTTITISPSHLYDLPVHGWVHTAHLHSIPDEQLVFAIEPLVYRKNTLELMERFDKFSRERIIHHWTSTINFQHDESRDFILKWKSGTAGVLMDGQPIGMQETPTEIIFSVESSHFGKEITIWLDTDSKTLDIILTEAWSSEDKSVLPPYEFFTVPFEKRFKRFDGQ